MIGLRMVISSEARLYHDARRLQPLV